jgi:hypothetical protein
MSRAWAAVAAASFSPVPDEPLARIEWTERSRTSPAPWQAPPGARPTWASSKPLRPGRRCPGRLDGELRGLFVRGLGDGADVVAHRGWEMWWSAVCASRNSARRVLRLPGRAGVRSRRHRDHQDPSRAHIARARSVSVSPEHCAASCSTVTLPAWLVDKLAAAAASVLWSVCR